MKIKLFIADAAAAIKRSPIEISLAIICSIIQILLEYNIFKSSGIEKDFITIVMYTFTYLFISYSFNNFFRNGKKRILYYLSILTPLIVYSTTLCDKIDLSEPNFIIIFNFSSVILALLARKSHSNENYSLDGVLLAKNIILSTVLMGISNLIISSAYYVICEIFFDTYFYHLGNVIAFVVFFNVTTLLFLTFEQKEEKGINKSRFVNLLFNYILNPALVLYGAILYLYFLKIVILWDLPKGIISATAITFIVGGILIKASRFVVEKPNLKILFKYFGIISLPALAMIWVGICYRISQYGFTENRIYLLTTAILLTIWVAADIFSRYNNYRRLSILSLVTFNLMTVGLETGLIFDNSKIEKEAIEERKSVSFNIINHNIDIVGWSEMVKLNLDGVGKYYYERKNDSINIYNSDKTLYHSISEHDFLNNVFKSVGIEDYTTTTEEAFNNIEGSLSFYKDDKVLIVIDYLELTFLNSVVKLDYLSLDWILTK